MEGSRDKGHRTFKSSGVFQSEPYVYRPPSPPEICVPEPYSISLPSAIPPITASTGLRPNAGLAPGVGIRSSYLSDSHNGFRRSAWNHPQLPLEGVHLADDEGSSDHVFSRRVSRRERRTRMLADILSRAQPLPDQANLLHERKALVLLPPTGAVAKCRNTDLTTAVRGPQLAPTDVDVHWRYDERWRAQPILDHVFLGPSAAARDVKFLRRANITLLLGIRDQRLARAQALGAAAERAAAQVREVYRHLWHQTESSVKARTSAGDESSHREGEGEANWWCQLPIVKYIDVVGPGPRFGNSHANSVDDAEPLVRALPSALDIINEHLAKAATSLSPSFLMADDEESQDNNDNGNGTNEKQQDVHEHDILYDYHPPQDPPGRVLVFCENGNGLSAVLVAAYLIASWGLSVSRACQWVSLRRFCATFTEPEKRVLLTFEDLLVARRQVEAAAAAAEAGGSDGDGIGHASAFSGTQTDHSVRTDPARARSEGGARMQKRGIEETRDDDEMVDCAMAMDVDGGAPDYATLAMDRDRFVGRDRHVPFIDIDPLGNMCGL